MQKLTLIVIGAVWLAAGELKAVTVNIYSGFSGNPGGAPYSGLVTNYSVDKITPKTVGGKTGLDSFGADIFGRFQIPKDGSYRFRLVAMDRCLMFIDGTQAADTDARRNADFLLTLTAGIHTFEIQYAHSAASGRDGGVTLHLPPKVFYVDPPGAVDLSFDAGSGVDGAVLSIAVQSDGKVVIGGTFNTVKRALRNNIARLNADGIVDDSFNPGSGANGPVNAVALHHDGKVLIAGGFTTVNGTARSGIARLNADGSVDSSFDPGTVSTGVTSMALHTDNKVLIAGSFANSSTSPRFLARLNDNGSLDTSFNFDPDPAAAYVRVSHVAVLPDERVVIAATQISPTSHRIRPIINRLNANGSLDSSFITASAGDESVVYSLALDADGRVLVGGNFGSGRAFVLRFNDDGSPDGSFLSGFGTFEGGAVFSLAEQPGGKVLAGGSFPIGPSFASGFISPFCRLNTDGSLDNSFDPIRGPSASVFSITLLSGGKIFIGGSFLEIRGVGRTGIALLDTDGSVDSSFNPGSGVDYFVHSLAVQSDGKVLTGGGFGSGSGIVIGANLNGIGRLNADGSLDDSYIPPVATDTRDVIYSLALQQDGKVILGGAFYSGSERNLLARLNSDGSLDGNFTSGIGAYGEVRSVALQPDGRMLIGGSFRPSPGTLLGTALLARVNDNGNLDSSFNAAVGPIQRTVYSIALQSDGKVLIGGNFISVNGTTRNGIARLNSDGSLDSSFDPGTGANFALVRSVAVQPDGKVLIGGDFTSVNGTIRNRVARLNSDGSLDTSFDTAGGADSEILSVAVDQDGKVLIGGSFSAINGASRNRIARLNTDGSLDSGFDPGTGANAQVDSVALQSDGRVLIGGLFTTVDGAARWRVARLLGDPLPHKP